MSEQIYTLYLLLVLCTLNKMETIIYIDPQNNEKNQVNTDLQIFDPDLEIPLAEVVTISHEDTNIKQRVASFCTILLFVAILSPVIIFGFILWFH